MSHTIEIVDAPGHCHECQKPLPEDTSALHHGCYDCDEEQDEAHIYVCSAECRKRLNCRQGQCEHWSMYDCKDFLGIVSEATQEEIAADREEKYKRKAEYELQVQACSPAFVPSAPPASPEGPSPVVSL